MKRMAVSCKQLLLLSAVFLVLHGSVIAEHEKEQPRIRTAPHRNVGSTVIDGAGTVNTLRREEVNGLDDRKDGSRRVPISTVAIFTLAMAAATGLGALPFFFVELNPEWAGICNGMAAGVMLAASFDLVQEGQAHGSGNWVVIGILAGGAFIWLCKKILLRGPTYSSPIRIGCVCSRIRTGYSYF